MSDGTLLKVRYDEDGLWRFDFIETGACDFSKVYANVREDTNDIVVLTGTPDQLKWVVFCTNKAFHTGE